MSIFEILDIVNNIISIFLLIGSFFGGLYLFFADAIRRWTFFGYMPTVILALIDEDRREILTVKYKRDIVLDKQLPQGGIYNGNILEGVENLIEGELGVELSDVHVEYTKALGSIKIKNTRRFRRFQYGMYSMAPFIRGKGYLLCICTVDRDRVLKSKKNRGIHVQNISFMDLDAFNEFISSKEFASIRKINLYKKILKIIDQWYKLPQSVKRI